MQNPGLSVAQLCAVTLLLLASACTPEPDPDALNFNIDHFLCYRGAAEDQPPWPGATPKIWDQFTESGAEGIGEPQPHEWKELPLVGQNRLFCNPVRKVRQLENGDVETTEIKNPDHHLTGFNFIEGPPGTGEEFPDVFIMNQFEDSTDIIPTWRSGLFVPTTKIEPGNHNAPAGLDHYVCYDSEAQQTPATVDLKDQFAEYPGAQIGLIWKLCNPALKVHPGDELPQPEDAELINPGDHLTCYDVRTERESPVRQVFVEHQFGHPSGPTRRVERINLDPNPKYLCVPTVKVVYG